MPARVNYLYRYVDVITRYAMKFAKNSPLKIAAFLLFLLMASLLVTSFFPRDDTYEGPILQLTLEQVVRLDEVAYTEEPNSEGQAWDYVIRPSSLETELVAIHIRIANKSAAVTAYLYIDALPPELRMDTGRYRPVNTFQARVPTDGFHAEKNVYVPLLRGSQKLEKGTELEGWLIFDVPKGSVAESFKWEAGGDVIIIDF